MTILAIAVAVNVFGILGLKALTSRVDRTGTKDLKRQHQCSPPNSYEHTPGEWITRRAVGDEWRCRCGHGWRVNTSGAGLWRAWRAAHDLDEIDAG